MSPRADRSTGEVSPPATDPVPLTVSVCPAASRMPAAGYSTVRVTADSTRSTPGGGSTFVMPSGSGAASPVRSGFKVTGDSAVTATTDATASASSGPAGFGPLAATTPATTTSLVALTSTASPDALASVPENTLPRADRFRLPARTIPSW